MRSAGSVVTPAVTSAHHTRVIAVCTVAALTLALLVGGSVPAAASGHGGDYEGAVDITFPVAGDTTYIDDYHLDRGGGTRKHQATDIGAPYGRPVHAAMGGEVSFVTGLDGNPPSYGYMISIRGDDGLTYHYIHLGRQDGPPSEAYVAGLQRGSRVARGEHIGFVGHSGNASASWPHLHFEIFDPSLSDPRIAQAPYQQGYLNPYASLQAAEARGDVPGAVAAVDQCAPPNGADFGSVQRVYGRNRYNTAANVARQRFGTAREAVIATGDGYADALAGAALAADRDAPLLLTRPHRLHGATATALSRLGVETVWLLGGERAVAPAVEHELEQLGVAVTRLAGGNRFETAAKIAGEVGAPDGEAVIATGRDFPDALGAGAFAAGARPIPLLLVEPDGIPRATSGALAALDVDKVWVLGGEQAVSARVANALEVVVGDVVRVAGANRYATSVQVAEVARARIGASQVDIVGASGADFPDALPAGALAAHESSVLVLLPSCDLDPDAPVSQHVRDRRTDFGRASIVGGPSAVSERVRAQLAEALEG
jgi:putative cell wall-binding protein